MSWLWYMVPVGLVLGLLMVWVDGLASPLHAPHDRVLASIDRLERELFPEWFPAQPKPLPAPMRRGPASPYVSAPEMAALAPRFKWAVRDHDDIRPLLQQQHAYLAAVQYQQKMLQAALYGSFVGRQK